MNPAALAAFRAHAQAEMPKEACGLLVLTGGVECYQPCRNIAGKPQETFLLDPRDYVQASAQGQITAVCHSHPYGSGSPSPADRAACEASGLPWFVLGWPKDELQTLVPEGFVAPLLDRQFVHGVHDCYALVRDYYKLLLSIDLPDFEREDQWWMKEGQNLYLDNFASAGFSRVEDLKMHDVILMQIRADRPNHAAVYLGDDKIIQHLFGHLSGRTVYGGFWAKNTWCVLRHEQLK